MERDEIAALLDNQRKHFNDAIDRMQRNCTKAQESSDKRVNEIIVSLEFTQGKLDEALKQLETANKERQDCLSKIQALTNENYDLKKQMKQHETRVDYLDDQSRRNNLRFAGIPEERGETWEHCQRKITRILKDHLNISVTAFDRVHRVGKYTGQRPRDIVARFTRFSDREAALRNRRKLKNTNIFINEDLCPSTIEIRQNQMGAFKDARKMGKHAFFSYRTLVVRDFDRTGRYGRSEQGERPINATSHTPPAPPTSPHTPPPPVPSNPPSRLHTPPPRSPVHTSPTPPPRSPPHTPPPPPPSAFSLRTSPQSKSPSPTRPNAMTTTERTQDQTKEPRVSPSQRVEREKVEMTPLPQHSRTPPPRTVSQRDRKQTSFYKYN